MTGSGQPTLGSATNSKRKLAQSKTPSAVKTQMKFSKQQDAVLPPKSLQIDTNDNGTYENMRPRVPSATIPLSALVD